MAFIFSKFGLLATIISMTGLHFYFTAKEPKYHDADQRVSIQKWTTVVRNEDVLDSRYAKMGKYNNYKIIDVKKQHRTKDPKESRTKRVKVKTQYEHKNDKRYSKKKRSQDLLQLVASVRSPFYKSDRLQTSDIFIDESQNFFKNKKYRRKYWHKRFRKFQRIYVSYNMRGPKALGAIQILTVAYTENPYKYDYNPFSPQIHRRSISRRWLNDNIKIRVNQTIVFKDTDIHSLSVKGNRLYLAGATSHSKFKTPAMLEVIRLNKNGLIPKKYRSARIDLPSYGATSVLETNNKVYVTVGDNGGGVVEFTSPHYFRPGTSKHTDYPSKFYPIEDPRYLSANRKNLYCVSGTQAQLWTKDVRSVPNWKKDPITTFPIEGGNIAESKSVVEVSGDYVYMAMGDGGTRIRSVFDYELLGHIPQKQIPYLDSGLTVTNALHVNGNELYTADGEAGGRVFQVDHKGNLKEMGSIIFGEGISANAVKVVGDFLIYGAGLGGVKFVKIFRHDNVKRYRDPRYRKWLRLGWRGWNKRNGRYDDKYYSKMRKKLHKRKFIYGREDEYQDQDWNYYSYQNKLNKKNNRYPASTKPNTRSQYRGYNGR